MKKKGKKATEVHATPRAMNADAPRRVVVMLPLSVVVVCKTNALKQGTTMTKYLAQIITTNVKG